MSLIKNENYVIIQGFMISELKLKGNELLVYAIIYGFSQDGESVFSGSRNYLASWCNVSLPTIDNALKSLRDKGLIEKKTEIKNNVTFNTYKISLVGVKNLYRGGKKSLHNNIEDNIVYNNKHNNKINKESLYDFVEENFGRTLSPLEYEEISKWEDNEITRYAIKEAVLRRALSVKYINAIIRDYEAKGIKTINNIKKIETSENEPFLFEYDWLEEE